MTEPIVLLLYVDNTLLDNDAAQGDYLSEIQRAVSAKAAQRYWKVFQGIVKERGYADYLGALQRYRLEDRHDPKLLHMSSFLLDYDFAAPVSPIVGGDRVSARPRNGRRSHRRRCRFPAAQDFKRRSVARGRRQGADLHPQRTGTSSGRAALPRRSIM